MDAVGVHAKSLVLSAIGGFEFECHNQIFQLRGWFIFLRHIQSTKVRWLKVLRVLARQECASFKAVQTLPQCKVCSINWARLGEVSKTLFSLLHS